MANRSGIEKCLIVLVIIIVVVAVAMVIAFLVYYFFVSPPEGTCLTDGCVRSASRLKEHMDNSLDPCNSFYQYACHGWAKKQVLGQGQSKIDVETHLYDQHLIRLRTLLNVEPETEEHEFIRKPKLFYKSCMNMDKLDDLETEPFMEVVDSIGKFPSLDPSWNSSNGDFNFQDMLKKLARMSALPFFQIIVKSAGESSTRNRLFLSDAKLGLGNRELYLESKNSKVLNDYKSWMVNTLVLLGASSDQAETDVEKIIAFEISLAKLMRDDESKANFKSLYKTSDVDTLQVKFTWIQWLELLQGITSSPDGGIGVYIGKDEIVVNTEPKYFEKLGELIKDTPDRVLANYMMSQLLPLTANLGDDFIRESEKYSKKVFGKENLRRWKFCALSTADEFDAAVSRMYIEKYFSKEAKKYVQEIVGDVLDVVNHNIDDNAWMGSKTKSEARLKLMNLDVKVGYPEELYDDEALTQLYREVSVDKDSYLMNHISLNKFKAEEQMKNLRKKQNNKQWTVQPTALDGRYDIVKNELTLPAAFLQSPIFNLEYSGAMNYAGIASIVGREVIHAFDSLGKEYDAKGTKSSWWSGRDKEGYESRSACFIKQWGCYKWDGLSMNGEKTLTENIAYNAGLKQAYKAYRRMIERKGSEEQRLPGMKLNNDQVFYLSYAQMWCAKYGDDAKQDYLETSVHPPFPYRVFGTLQNSQRFSDVFSCGIGTRMNPREKCKMW